MTEGRFISDIRAEVIARLEKSDMTIPELCSSMPDEDWLIERLMEQLAAERKVCISKGSSGKKWTTTAKARSMAMAEGEDDAE